MVSQSTLRCPVGKEKLGYWTKGEVCSFICTDCGFMFTWDKDGVLRPPIKIEHKKPKKCTCESCKARDEKF